MIISLSIKDQNPIYPGKRAQKISEGDGEGEGRVLAPFTTWILVVIGISFLSPALSQFRRIFILVMLGVHYGITGLSGPFQSINAGIGPGAVNIQTSPDTWLFTPSISMGPAAGGYGNLTTNTVRLPDSPAMTVINSVPKLPR